MIARLLFGRPGDLFDRHQWIPAVGLLLCVLVADFILGTVPQ